MRLEMVEMERLLGMADFNVKQMTMLLVDFLQNSSGKRYGVNCWRILEMGSCSPMNDPSCGGLFCLFLSVTKFAVGSVSDSSNHQERMVYSSKNVVAEFASKLTAEEAKTVEEKDGFLSAKPPKIPSLHVSKLLEVATKFRILEKLDLWNGMIYWLQWMLLLRMGWISVFEDSMAAGAFGATHIGIFMFCSAGNEVSFDGSVSNEAPWILAPSSPRYMSPVYTGSNGSESAAFCAPESLTDIDARDKIVLCEGGGGTALQRTYSEG
ncbi:hypothetical protein SADUNF_Sadunf01G0090200 [Salix dunnii]|uniref:Uncharacterized protein n=1 Tax=Salix dunnii TaxID=1413687 RepID=A0A835TMS6_9ROSI|nr:hypothetical protein SADUNF_Sadunf01G0090200 [Salix dunnii]